MCVCGCTLTEAAAVYVALDRPLPGPRRFKSIIMQLFSPTPLYTLLMREILLPCFNDENRIRKLQYNEAYIFKGTVLQ